MAVFAAPAIVAAIGAYGSSLAAEKDRKAFLETDSGKALIDSTGASKKLDEIRREIETKEAKIRELTRQLELERKAHEDEKTKIKIDSKDLEESEKLFANVSSTTLRKAMNDLKERLKEPTPGVLKLIDKTAGAIVQRGSLSSLYFNLKRAGKGVLELEPSQAGGADTPEETAKKTEKLAEVEPPVSQETRDATEAFLNEEEKPAPAVPEPAAEPAPTTEPVAESTAEPAPAAVTEPVGESTTEPAPAAAEPVSDAVAETVADAVAEPVVATVAETAPVAQEGLTMRGFLEEMGKILKKADAEITNAVEVIQTTGPKAVKSLKLQIATEKTRLKKEKATDMSPVKVLTTQMGKVESALKDLAKSKDDKTNTTAQLEEARKRVEELLAAPAPEPVAEPAVEPATTEPVVEPVVEPAAAPEPAAEATPEPAAETAAPPAEEDVTPPPATSDSGSVSTTNPSAPPTPVVGPTPPPEETDKFEMINPMYATKPTDMYTKVGKTPFSLPTKGEAKEAPIEKTKRLFTKKNRLGSRKGKATVIGRARKNTLRRRRGGK